MEFLLRQITRRIDIIHKSQIKWPRYHSKQAAEEAGFCCRLKMVPLQPYIYTWSRHFLSQKLWQFHKNTRSCVENECCCPRTVNISNVNFTSKISIHDGEFGVWDLGLMPMVAAAVTMGMGRVHVRVCRGVCYGWRRKYSSYFNSLRPRLSRHRFADDVFKCNFLNENVWIPIKISLKFVPKGPINNIPALVQIMAWRRTGDKPLSEPMMTQLNDANMRHSASMN